MNKIYEAYKLTVNPITEVKKSIIVDIDGEEIHMDVLEDVIYDAITEYMDKNEKKILKAWEFPKSVNFGKMTIHNGLTIEVNYPGGKKSLVVTAKLK